MNGGKCRVGGWGRIFREKEHAMYIIKGKKKLDKEVIKGPCYKGNRLINIVFLLLLRRRSP